MEEQRKKFEEWYMREYPSRENALRRGNLYNEMYSLFDVQMAWYGWQAAVMANVELSGAPLLASPTRTAG